MVDITEISRKALERLQATGAPPPETDVTDVTEISRRALERLQVPQLEPALPEVPGRRLAPGTAGFGVSFEPLPPSRREIIESRGLKIREDTPVAARLAARFGTIEDVEAQLPEGTEVTNLPDIGFVARNPQTGEFEVLNPPGIDPGDIAVEAVDILPTAIEATVGILSRNPLALAAAGGAARASILADLKSLGIVADPNILTEAALEAGLSLAGPAAARVRRFVDPERRALEAITAKGTPSQFEAGREQAEQLAGDVEAVTGVRPQFPIGQQLGIVEPEQARTLVGAESTLDVGLQAERTQRQASEALQERFRRGAIAPEAVEPAAERITKRQELIAAGEVKKVEQTAERQVKKIDADLDKISGNTSPTEIRAGIAESVEQSRRAISQEYNSIAVSAEDAAIDLTGLETVSKDILDRAKIFPGGDQIFKDTFSAAKLDRVRARQQGLTGIKPKGKDLNTYKVAQEARSDLRAHIRGLVDAKASGPEIARARRLENEFTSAINDGLSVLDPNLTKRLVKADLTFRSLKEKVDKGFVGKLLSTREGVAVVPDETLIKTVFANTSDMTRFLNSAAEFFPEVGVKNQLKDAFFTQYRDKVLSGKVPHQTFMRQIKDTGDLVFSKGELKALENAGTAKNRVKAVLKRRDDRIEKINKTFGVTVGKIEPHNLVAEISKSAVKTARLKKILTPEEWIEYQGARRARLSDDITDTKGNLSLTGISKVLKRSEAELRQSVGPEYVKDLKTARRFLETLAKKQQGFEKTVAKAATTGIDVGRALLFGPLDHRNFVINKISGFGKDASARALSKLLNDPKLLAERVKIFNSPERIQRERLIDFWGALGIPLVLSRGTAIPESEEAQ